jgi:HAD superfamily hydrolase (TIGR01450 family)
VSPATWLLDLDGVLWLGDRPIPGSSDAITQLRAAGHAVAFCTNNSHATVDDYVAKLAAHGVEAAPDELLTSAMALGRLIAEGQSVLMCGGPGLAAAVTAAGAIIVDPDGTDPVDVVAVGFNPEFDYRLMTRATRAVLGGARLMASNNDPIYPSGDGPAPGAGAILASIERATRATATVAGKPHEAMAALAQDRYPAGGVMVGDSLDTDGAFAAALGWPFGLVLSGNTQLDRVPADQPADWVADDLAALVDRHLADLPAT